MVTFAGSGTGVGVGSGEGVGTGAGRGVGVGGGRGVGAEVGAGEATTTVSGALWQPAAESKTKQTIINNTRFISTILVFIFFFIISRQPYTDKL